jgi:hypothetical protein
VCIVLDQLVDNNSIYMYIHGTNNIVKFLGMPKHLFIIPTDSHNYKITGMLKTIKIPTIAPTCFGSRRNHHQGAISYLTKTTIMMLLCSSLIIIVVLVKHEVAP